MLKPQVRSAEQWQSIRDLFTKNLIFNEERGKLATGIATVDSLGNIELLKLPIKASQFIGLSEYDAVMSRIGSKTTLILGHTRLPTKGDPSQRANNHPVQAGTVLGVHNGHIENDDELFVRCECQRQANVDSEIIFRLIEKINPIHKDVSYLSSILPFVQLLKGEFTFLAIDQRSPSQMVVLKHKNPLCIHFHRQWNALIFSSRYIFLRKIFGHSIVAETLKQDHLMLFDANHIAEMGISPNSMIPI